MPPSEGKFISEIKSRASSGTLNCLLLFYQCP